MPGDEHQANTSEVASTSSSTVTTEVQPLLPVGFAMPKPLKTEGNLASNWKKFKRAWDNYAIVARLNRFEEEFKTATFLLVKLVETPRKFIIAELSIRKLGSSSVLIILLALIKIRAYGSKALQ